MAIKVKTNKKKRPDILDAPVAKQMKINSLAAQTIAWVKANPVIAAATAGFILLCGVIGLMYGATSDSAKAAEMAQFARSLDSEDATARAAGLDSFTKKKNPLNAEALYLVGESEFEAKQYDKAKEVFERVRKETPNSPFAPDAVEGLGYVAESEGKDEEAIALYNEIGEKWKGSFTQRRQKLNIARCQERLGRIPEAIAAYKAQSEEFPGSSLDKDAKAALDRLRLTNPDLFPKEEAAAPAPTPAEGQPADAAKPAEAAPAPAPPTAPEPPAAPAEQDAPKPAAP